MQQPDGHWPDLVVASTKGLRKSTHGESFTTQGVLTLLPQGAYQWLKISSNALNRFFHFKVLKSHNFRHSFAFEVLNLT